MRETGKKEVKKDSPLRLICTGECLCISRSFCTVGLSVHRQKEVQQERRSRGLVFLVRRHVRNARSASR